MKTVLLAFALVAAMIFTGCEEEEEPAQTLTAFVIGEWESQDLLMGDTEAHFLADFETGFFTMTLVVGEESATLPKTAYTVDDESNVITIDQPQFPGEEPSGDKIPFDVIWDEGGNTMTWLPVDPLEDDGPPTIVWTRQTGM